MLFSTLDGKTSNAKHSQNGFFHNRPAVGTIVLTGARINTQLEKGGKPGIKDLKTDFCDGVRLLYLLVFPLFWGVVLTGQEIMSDVDLGKWNRKPYHRFHFVENCVWALNYIRDNGVALTNIGAEGLNSGIWSADGRYC